MNGDLLDVDFVLVKQQAAKLDEIASSMETLSDQSLGGTLQEISVNWKGDNANLFLGKGDILKGNMTVTAQNLRDIATSIRARANFIYRKEQNAVDIARTRAY